MVGRASLAHVSEIESVKGKVRGARVKLKGRHTFQSLTVPVVPGSIEKVSRNVGKMGEAQK